MAAFVLSSPSRARYGTGTEIGSSSCGRRSFVSPVRGAQFGRHSHASPLGSRASPVKMVTASGLKKVVIAGGTGFVGKNLCRKLVDDGCDEVIVLSRSKSSSIRAVVTEPWDPTNPDGDWVNTLKGADAVVNLCGELIVQRWSESVKERLVQSRLGATKTLVAALGRIDEAERPKAFVSSSAVGFYGISDSEEFTEESRAGTDFLADLCVKWEAAAMKATDLGVRVVIFRNGIVLGRGGGALNVMMPVFKLGLGGLLGSGKQYMSWVSIRDVAAMYELAAGTPSMEGVYNATAPVPCTNAQMTKALASALSRPAFLPAPAFAIQAVFAGGATVLLDGQKVLPKRMETEGFPFSFETIDEAMKDIVNNPNGS